MFLSLLQRIPTLRLLMAYLTGLLASGLDGRLAASSLAFGLWFYLLYGHLEQRLRTNWPVRWLPGMTVVCIWMAFGYLAGTLAWRQSEFPAAQSGLNQSNIDMHPALLSPSFNLRALAVIDDDPVEKKRSWQLCLTIRQSNPDGWVGKKLMIYLAKDSLSATLRCGDRIVFMATPEPLKQPPDTARFNYARWLRVKGICASAYVRKSAWRFVAPPSRWDLKARASRIRSMLVAAFRQSGLSGDGLALVSAMSFGARDELSKELKNEFAVTGITHILSVSGLHVAVIYALLKVLLFFLGFSATSRKLREAVIILLLWFFAFVTGLSPSVNRSALMFTLLAVGTILGRGSQTLNTVLFSAFVLLLINPLYLYDVGFQLSYCAVLGIVVIYPRVKRLWRPAFKPVNYIWEMACLSVVAQLVTTPLTIGYFGQFPNYFLVSNLVAVPLSGWVIYASAGYLMASGVPGLSLVAAWCLKTCTQLFLDFVDAMSRLPYAVSQGLELHPEQVVLLYVILLAVFGWLFLKQRRSLIYGMAGLLCFQLSWLFHQIG